MAIGSRLYSPRLVRGFSDFIRERGILTLAVGVVIGNAVNDFVKSVVDGLIAPFISLISPQTKLQTFQVEINGSVFKIGQVLNALLSFLIIALIVYLVAKAIFRQEEKAEDPNQSSGQI